MSLKNTKLPRLVQAADRANLLATAIRLHGYKVLQQSLLDKTINSEFKTLFSIGEDVYIVSSPVFIIEDEAHVWKLKYEEYSEMKESSETEADSVFLGDMRFKTRKVEITGDPDGSQLKELCQKGIIDDIQSAVKNTDFENLLLNLCDVPYPRPEDLCDKILSNAILKLPTINRVLVIYPKMDAEDCGWKSGFEGTWSRYLATDLVVLQWHKDECHFMTFEKRILKHVVKNGYEDSIIKDVTSLPESEQITAEDKVDGKRERKAAEDKLENESVEDKTDGEKIKEGAKSMEKKPLRKISRNATEKLAKKDDKTVSKSVKKEVKSPKSDGVVRRESKIQKNEQNASKRNSRVLKSDSKSLKNEVGPRSNVKKEQKSLGKISVNDESRRLTNKHGDKTSKNNAKMNAAKAGDEISEVEIVTENDDNKFEKYKIKMKETYTNLANVYKSYKNKDSTLLSEVLANPAFRGFCLIVVLFAFYILSTEILVTLLLLASSVWFKYGSKEPEFQKYTRSRDPRVLEFRVMYEREIEKLRYAKDLERMRDVHVQLKESVLNAYAVTRVAQGDKIGIKEHEVLERELELTFKEFVTANDVKSLLHEAHHTSFFLAFTVFVYLTSRLVYLLLRKIWRPVRTVAIILAGILLCFVLGVISNFLLTTFISRRLQGSAEMLSVLFGLWLVTDVTGYLIEIRACIDHVTGVIWRESDLERCIIKTHSYHAVKLALDCTVLLSLFPIAYLLAGVLSYFSVSSYTIVSFSQYFPPIGFFFRMCTRLAFFGEILRFLNLVILASLASKFYGLHKKREDPLDSLLYERLGYDTGHITEYIWKKIVNYLNDFT